MTFPQRAIQKQIAAYATSQQIFTPPPPLYQAQPPLYPYNMSQFPLTTQITHHEESDSDDDDEGRLSEIRITINTPLHVNGNDNLISVDTAANASKISTAITTALRQISTAGGGVPLIDANGEPRPIRVDVTAEIKVVGSNNVVGDRAVMGKTLSRDSLKKLETTEQGANLQGKVPEQGNGQLKREHSEDGPSETGAKRARVQ
ncbi:hypothetical protein G7Y89_g13337 [Cudoniella acicularis]|uniref:Uncharacterized protein n=1 Tax=Cudoniella acicularis TaxID=354080 RepID=A0A8H4RAX6_9HELO|nr:hypothetical protein G7Y89_g13337 [Cudoniella acicularis]